MTSDLEKKMLAGAAYRIFYEEVQKHMAAGQILIGATVDPKECKEMSMRFHTIRGGAGFFQLKEISELATKLEKMLLMPDANINLDEARGIFRQLEVLVRGMPAPVQQ